MQRRVREHMDQFACWHLWVYACFVYDSSHSHSFPQRHSIPIWNGRWTFCVVMMWRLFCFTTYTMWTSVFFTLVLRFFSVNAFFIVLWKQLPTKKRYHWMELCLVGIWRKGAAECCAPCAHNSNGSPSAILSQIIWTGLTWSRPSNPRRCYCGINTKSGWQPTTMFC